MGNCLVSQQKMIQVMKTDGKILEYQSPLKVHQVLSDLAGHAISDKLPVTRHLRPDDEMVGGQLYYLLPLPPPPPPLGSPKTKKKKVRFAIPEEVEAGDQEEGGKPVVRIKLVITKKELGVLLRKGGVTSVDEMVSQLQKSQNDDADEFDDDHQVDGNRSCKGRKPVLERIPEVVN